MRWCSFVLRKGLARLATVMTALALATGMVVAVVPSASASPIASGRAARAVRKAPNPVAAPVVAAVAAARRAHRRVEVTAARTAFSQTFANPNGTMTAVISAQPRSVRRGSSWVGVNPDLVHGPDGSWAPAAAPGGLKLSGGGSQALATLTSGTQSMTLSWPSVLPAPVVAGPAATYASVFPGVDLVVTAQVAGGFSQALVIHNAAAARDPQLQNLTLGVSLSTGLSQRPAADGAVAVVDASGRKVFTSPAPLAWDSTATGAGPVPGVAGPGRGARTAMVPAAYGAGSVRLTMPGGLLASSSTVFPVFVDPAYSVTQTSTVYGEIQSAYPTTNEYDNTYNSQVATGNDGGGVDRGDYAFGLPAGADGPNVNVVSATMTAEAVATYSSTQVSHTVNAYQTSAYTTSTTWNNPPTQQAGPNGQTFITTSKTPNQNVTWTVTSWLQSILHGNGTQFSAELVSSDETNDGTGFVAFSNSPQLSITYDQVPAVTQGTGPVPNGTLLSFPISDKVSLKVNVGSGDALLTTSDVTMPETGGALGLGAAYNSLLAGAGISGSMGAYGWTQRQGMDVGLYPAADGSVTFLGPDGTAGKFTANGSAYTSPPVFHATLAKSSGSTCGGIGWTMTWHDSGQVMCFSSSGWLTSQADRNGNTTAFTYNSGQKETSITYTPRGASAPTQTVNTTLNSGGSLLTGLTENGGSAGTKTVSYYLNSSTGNLSSITQADNASIQFGYDSANNLTSIQNGASNTTQLTYNAAHQVTSVTQPTTSGNTATTRLSYVSSTETQVADPNTNQSQPVSSVPNVTYTINSGLLVTKAVDQAGDSRSTSYTSFNDVLTFTNGENGQTANTYGLNSGESLTADQSPTGAKGSLAYGNANSGTNPTAAFQPSSSTDAQKNATAYTYDGAGNLLQSADALPATAKVTYNSDGTPATSTDPKNGTNSTGYGYNSAHQLNKITPPTGSSLLPTTVSYDGFGRVSAVTGGDGNTVTYTYDLADRVNQASYTGGAHPVTVTYAYDGAGNLKTQADPSGTTSYTYDGRNLALTRNATSGGGTLSYTYDADGNLSQVQDAGGLTKYSYDNRNLLASLTDPAGNLWQFAYNPDGLRTTTWFATNSGNTSWAEEMVTSYDNADRITRIQAFRNSSTSNVVSDISYCYSSYVSGKSCPTGTASTDTALVKYSVNNQTSTVSQYGYDTGNRLTSVTNDGGKNYSYGYDTDGNLTTGASYGSLTYNSANQISTAGCAYDGAGNMTLSNINGTQAYNDAGQMTSASNANGHGTESFAYAGTSQAQVLSDGSAAGITYGLAGQGGQPWVQSYTPAGASADYVIHDQQGTPLGYVQGGTAYGFVTDNLGSVTNVIGSCGCTEATYSYDPDGNLTSKSGPDAADNLIGYTGALSDTGTGATTLYVHDGNRWYSPNTGSFTTQDTNSYVNNPANGNRYAYAADNPANYTDPTGQDIWGDVVAGVLTVAGGALAVAGVVVSAPALIVGGAVVGIAGVGVWVYQTECKYGGAGSMWTMPGQCTVFG